eukprot:tig00000310_g23959.t1
MAESKDKPAALEELRSKLNAALIADVKATPTEKTILWGVDLETVSPASDCVLGKFLKARENKVDDALKMLVDCLKWRKEFDIEGLMKESFPAAYDGLGCLYGDDLEGRPVCVNLYGGIDTRAVFEEEGGVDRFVRWRVQLMERGIARLDFSKGPDAMVQIHDYAGVSLLKYDKNVQAASKKVVALFLNYYPELMYRKFFINIPWFMDYIYALMSALSSDRTRAKFVLCSASALRAKLFQFIGVERLPPPYGGFGPELATAAGAPSPAALPGPFRKIHVDARNAGEVQVPVKAGQAVRYQLTVESGDISVSASMAPGAEGGSGEELLAPARHDRTEGSVTAPRAGTLVFRLDNSYSLLTSKEVYLRTDPAPNSS